MTRKKDSVAEARTVKATDTYKMRKSTTVKFTSVMTGGVVVFTDQSDEVTVTEDALNAMITKAFSSRNGITNSNV